MQISKAIIDLEKTDKKRKTVEKLITFLKEKD